MRMLRVFAVAILATGSGVAAGAFAPVSLESVANASRMDERAADGRGGWLDLGSNDLRMLPAGRQTFAKVPFDVPDCTGECHRTCLVLGRSGKEKVELKAPAGARGNRLYLLHAIADGPAPQKREIAAKLKVNYRGGGEIERRLRTGRDVAEWTGGRSFDNAARAWTVYNKTTQVSLFVSAFDLDEGREVESITFKAAGTCPWMVLAATVGEKVNPKALMEKKPLTGTFRAPPPPDALKVYPEGQRPKNVILLIGDGMGLSALRLASLYLHGRDEALYTHHLPFAGLCTTHSANAPVTDSAASGTAIATGVKTSNGTLGLRIASAEERKAPKRLVSVAERAHADGRAVALLTNDRSTGATPAAFYAHVAGRGEAAKIAEQASACGYEVLLGQAGERAYFLPGSAGGKRSDGRNLLDEMARAGYANVDSLEAFDAVPATQKAMGLISRFEGDDCLGRAVKTALRHVGDAPKGFFMMAECATPDKGGHGNDPSVTVKGVVMLDWMVREAVAFAEARGDTLVVVTADHETGGLYVTRGARGGLTYAYTATSHTGTPVALYAYGPGAERFGRALDNTDIARTFSDLLGLGED